VVRFRKKNRGEKGHLNGATRVHLQREWKTTTEFKGRVKKKGLPKYAKAKKKDKVTDRGSRERGVGTLKIHTVRSGSTDEKAYPFA